MTECPKCGGKASITTITNKERTKRLGVCDRCGLVEHEMAPGLFP